MIPQGEAVVDILTKDHWTTLIRRRQIAAAPVCHATQAPHINAKTAGCWTPRSKLAPPSLSRTTSRPLCPLLAAVSSPHAAASSISVYQLLDRLTFAPSLVTGRRFGLLAYRYQIITSCRGDCPAEQPKTRITRTIPAMFF